ncbi:MAG: adenylyl-sulfate kinase [Candidatus Pelagibacterales bacterium]|jgi:adenylylsulfate kinase|tara:strand:+ start:2400 stop:2897 length:498 start_codon:yes stop_codon:yes gene_type:complete
MKILVCGLPGSGKTWLSERLADHLDNCAWYNADTVRRSANDWDFSMEGRTRQANRMKTFADFEISHGRWVICDFVAPTKNSRKTFDPDYVIWLDTVKEGRVVAEKEEELKGAKDLPFDVATLEKSQEFENTNKVFDPPQKIDQHVTRFLSDDEIREIAEELKKNV